MFKVSSRSGTSNIIVVKVDDRIINMRPPLGSIVSSVLQFLQVIRTDIAGDVLSVEATGVKLNHARAGLLSDFNWVVQRLIEQSVASNRCVDFLNGAAAGDEFLHGRHVDAVDVGCRTGGAAEAK